MVRTKTKRAGRARLVLPPLGEPRRQWLREQLGKIDHPETGRGWTQADVARGVGVSEALVSLVFVSDRRTGPVVDSVQALTADLLGLPVETLFGHVCDCCPRCGTKHRPEVIRPKAEAKAGAKAARGKG